MPTERPDNWSSIADTRSLVAVVVIVVVTMLTAGAQLLQVLVIA